MFKDYLKPKSFIIVVLVVLFSIGPLLTKSGFLQNIFYTIFFYIILAESWNILAGFAGQFSMGHPIFFGIGAYTSSLLFIKFGISPWIGLFAGIAAATTFSIIFSVLFRLQALFFAIGSAGLLLVIGAISTYWRNLTGGGYGLYFPYEPSIVNFIFDSDLPYIYITWFFAASTILIAFLINRSKLGSSLFVIKDSEVAAASIGINTYKNKLIALLISSSFASIAGTILAQRQLYINPSSVFSFPLVVDIIVISVIGGIGTIMGPIIGACIYGPLSIFLRSWVGGELAGLNYIILAIILVVIIFWARGGVIGWLNNILHRNQSSNNRSYKDASFGSEQSE